MQLVLIKLENGYNFAYNNNVIQTCGIPTNYFEYLKLHNQI